MHDYSNVGPNGEIDHTTTPAPPKPPRPPVPSYKPTLIKQGSSEAPKRSPFTKQGSSEAPKRTPVTKQGSSEAPKRSPVTKPKPQSYNPVVVDRRQEGVEPSAEYDDPDVLGLVKGQSASTRPGMYDDVDEVIGSLNKHRGRGKGNPPIREVSNGTHSVEENVYDPVDPGIALASPLSPKFDDTIYNRLPSNNQAGGLMNMGK